MFPLCCAVTAITEVLWYTMQSAYVQVLKKTHLLSAQASKQSCNSYTFFPIK